MTKLIKMINARKRNWWVRSTRAARMSIAKLAIAKWQDPRRDNEESSNDQSREPTCELQRPRGVWNFKFGNQTPQKPGTKSHWPSHVN